MSDLSRSHETGPTTQSTRPTKHVEPDDGLDGQAEKTMCALRSTLKGTAPAVQVIKRYGTR